MHQMRSRCLWTENICFSVISCSGSLPSFTSLAAVLSLCSCVFLTLRQSWKYHFFQRLCVKVSVFHSFQLLKTACVKALFNFYYYFILRNYSFLLIQPQRFQRSELLLEEKTSSVLMCPRIAMATLCYFIYLILMHTNPNLNTNKYHKINVILKTNQ